MHDTNLTTSTIDRPDLTAAPIAPNGGAEVQDSAGRSALGDDTPTDMPAAKQTDVPALSSLHLGRMTLSELVALMPFARWSTDRGALLTSAELRSSKKGYRPSRRIVFDGCRVFAGRTGLKTRSVLLRLVDASGD